MKYTKALTADFSKFSPYLQSRPSMIPFQRPAVHSPSSRPGWDYISPKSISPGPKPGTFFSPFFLHSLIERRWRYTSKNNSYQIQGSRSSAFWNSQSPRLGILWVNQSTCTRSPGTYILLCYPGDPSSHCSLKAMKRTNTTHKIKTLSSLEQRNIERFQENRFKNLTH